MNYYLNVRSRFSRGSAETAIPVYFIATINLSIRQTLDSGEGSITPTGDSSVSSERRHREGVTLPTSTTVPLHFTVPNARYSVLR